MTDARIDLVRLTEVPLDAVVALLNEPRNTRHMPLSNPFTPEGAREWVQAKDGQWAEHGYGPWAVLVDGHFAGWGGFQREPNGADFALVLFPNQWGRGAAITREVLQRGFTERPRAPDHGAASAMAVGGTRPASPGWSTTMTKRTGSSPAQA